MILKVDEVDLTASTKHQAMIDTVITTIGGSRIDGFATSLGENGSIWRLQVLALRQILVGLSRSHGSEVSLEERFRILQITRRQGFPESYIVENSSRLFVGAGQFEAFRGRHGCGIRGDDWGIDSGHDQTWPNPMISG
jgi:hypothetical protein